MCNKQNLFHQSEQKRRGELEHMHIVLFKSPRDVIEVSTRSPQLGRGWKLFDW